MVLSGGSRDLRARLFQSDQLPVDRGLVQADDTGGPRPAIVRNFDRQLAVAVSALTECLDGWLS